MIEIGLLERAIEYIETHLNEPIGLSHVSRETGYSHSHMTRLFSSVFGESVGRYINRRGTFANRFKTYQYIFEVYEREVLSFVDPNNEVKIYIPIK